MTVANRARLAERIAIVVALTGALVMGTVILIDGDALFTQGGAPTIPDIRSLLRPQPDPMGSMMPACVDSSSPHVRMFYARASDRADNYAANVSKLREAANTSNGQLHESAALLDYHAEIRVLCDASDVINVTPVVFSTPFALTTHQSVESDLRALGYLNGQAKAWVAFDGAPLASAGFGKRYNDDRPGPENLNNQPGSVAIIYAAHGGGPWLHELLHTLGAVQDSAPNADGGAHIKGGDLMAPSGGHGVDLDHDDYFHPNPPGGSYLATHWNVARSHWLNVYPEVHSQQTPEPSPLDKGPLG